MRSTLPLAFRATRAAAGASPKFAYPKQVWSPAGGWWVEPAQWQRNTMYAGAAMGGAVACIWIFSARNERRPMPPVRHIPSQYWSKHAADDDPSLR